MEDLVKELTIDMIPDGDNRIIAETIGVENYYKLCSVVGGSTIYLLAELLPPELGGVDDASLHERFKPL